MKKYSEEFNFFGKKTPFDLINEFGSPLYVYNEDILRRACRDLKSLSNHPQFYVNYSAKANTNLSLLKIIREEGLIVDAMSPGELYINKMAGFTSEEILYVCNNVDASELKNAVENDVLISVDSLSQVELYGKINPGGKILVRINPGIGAGHSQKVITGGKKTKFGISPELFGDLYEILDKYNLKLAGLTQHIGSLFMKADDYLDAVDFILDFIATMPQERCKDFEIIDFGGGFGIPYHKNDGEARLDLDNLGSGLDKRMKDFCALTAYKGKFLIEPGRYVVAECSILLGNVLATKYNGDVRYVGTDVGFNVLMRPAMYESYHEIEVYPQNNEVREITTQHFVGNICESGDVLAKDRKSELAKEGDLIGLLDAGAYGFAMASPYNQRCRPAEVLIKSDGSACVIRRRETIEDIVSLF